ncbi:MAG: energy-coupling factor ABC transporter permease [Candidatus Desantisbacteria bacterium]
MQRFVTLGVSLFCWLLLTTDAHAMHISEGILPLNWAAFWFAIAIPFVAFGLYRMKKLSSIDPSFKALVGLMAAIVFIISCMPIPVPTAGTCSHPCGTAISGILVGPFISVVIAAAALLIQALFLAHGGLSTWGADIVSMGVVGSFAGYLIFKGLRALKANLWIAGFMAGLLADWATYLTTSVELTSGIRGDSPFMPLFWKILAAFIPTQLPLGILEGAMTAGMIVLLYKKRPELLVKMGVVKEAEGRRLKAEGRKQNVATLLLALLLLLSFTPAFAEESKWPGVDESVVEKYAQEHGRAAREPLINTDQGDLLLFVFLLAGTVGGFIGGYCWRVLMSEKSPKTNGEEQRV